MHDPENRPEIVETEPRLSAEEIERSLGITREELEELVGLGLAEPAAPGTAEFTATTMVRLRRVRRLHADLELDFLGAAIIVDLMEKLDALEAEVHAMRSRRSP